MPDGACGQGIPLSLPVANPWAWTDGLQRHAVCSSLALTGMAFAVHGSRHQHSDFRRALCTSHDCSYKCRLCCAANKGPFMVHFFLSNSQKSSRPGHTKVSLNDARACAAGSLCITFGELGRLCAQAALAAGRLTRILRYSLSRPALDLEATLARTCLSYHWRTSGHIRVKVLPRTQRSSQGRCSRHCYNFRRAINIIHCASAPGA